MILLEIWGRGCAQTSIEVTKVYESVTFDFMRLVQKNDGFWGTLSLGLWLRYLS